MGQSSKAKDEKESDAKPLEITKDVTEFEEKDKEVDKDIKPSKHKDLKVAKRKRQIKSLNPLERPEFGLRSC
jgi:hypothetical protein